MKVATGADIKYLAINTERLKMVQFSEPNFSQRKERDHKDKPVSFTMTENKSP